MTSFKPGLGLLPNQFGGQPLNQSNSLGNGNLGGPFTGGTNLGNNVQFHAHSPDGGLTLTGGSLKQGQQTFGHLNGYESAMMDLAGKPFSRR